MNTKDSSFLLYFLPHLAQGKNLSNPEGMYGDWNGITLDITGNIWFFIVVNCREIRLM
jgi:hypothetical protein